LDHRKEAGKVEAHMIPERDHRIAEHTPEVRLRLRETEWT
jgi:hypothetical protein